MPSNSVTLPATPRWSTESICSPLISNSVGSRASRVSSSATPSSFSSSFWRGRPSFSMSMCASTAMNEPSSSFTSGLISASVMSYFTKSLASLERIGVSWFRSEPVMPTDAITSLAMKSMWGRIVEKWPRPMWSGCCSATSSMSMPPMSEKTNVGFLAIPS